MYQLETSTTVEIDPPCRRGRLCVGRDLEGHPAYSSRPICDGCASALADALAAFPSLLRALEDELPRGYQSIGDAPVSGGDPEPGLPIRLEVDEAIRDLAAVLQRWADRVWAILPGVPAHVVRAVRFQREGRQPRDMVTLSVWILTNRISVLLALAAAGDELVPAFEPDAEPRRLDGGDGALELLHVHHRALRITGQTRRWNKLDEPCRACGVAAVGHWDGADPVKCRACRTEWEDLDRWLDDERIEPDA